MKKQILLSLILVLITCIICSCGGGENGDTSLWDSATYSESTAVGEGATTFTVSVEAEDKTVILTVSTDETVLGTALYSLGITNDPSFFNTVNGMVADWDKDQAYWAFYVGDEYASVGVDQINVAQDAVYKLVYTK